MGWWDGCLAWGCTALRKMIVVMGYPPASRTVVKCRFGHRSAAESDMTRSFRVTNCAKGLYCMNSGWKVDTALVR
jgi:hypothetical protein